jgi:hypothetical protein
MTMADDSTPITYSLVPWVRRGLASRVAGVPTKNYAELPVAYAINNAAPTAGPTIRLLGPGEVTSLDAAAVIRTDPRDGADDFEPNYLPVVELAQPDLPWLFSPAAPDDGKLRPWICLIVVADVDGVALEVPRSGCAVLQLSDPQAELPDLTHVEAWAHGQVIGDGLSGKALAAALDSNPAAHLSRLVASRMLAPNRGYIGCVVPTYQAGVNAGLGLPVDEKDLAPAWAANTVGLFKLPVYYHFRFRTGPGGDFKSLARRIVPPAKPLDAGKRSVNIGEPGFGLNAAPGIALGFEGALRARNAQPSPWPADAQAPYEAQLRGAPAAGPDPVVSPPVYGRAQSGKNLQQQDAPVWQRDLNLDPRMRAAAGAGSQVVQRDQEAMVASAWDQLGEIRKANQLLRQAQLARGASASMQRRHLETIASDGAYLQVTAPVHARVRVALDDGGGTVSMLTLRGHIEASRLPMRAVSAAMRKLARPRGPLGRQLPAGRPQQMVERLNQPASAGATALTAAGPLQAPRGMVALDDVSPEIQLAKMSSKIPTTVSWVSVTVAPISPPVSPQISEGAHAVGPTPGTTTPLAVHPTAPLDRVGDSVSLGGAAPQLVEWNRDPDVPDILKGGRPNFPSPFVFPSDAAGLQQMAVSFRTAASSINQYLNAAAAPPPDSPPLGGSAPLSSVRTQLRQRLNPELTIAARFRARIPLGAGTDPLQPLDNAPQFPQPMYSALADLSPAWMLPGVDKIPMNAAVLLQTNPRFVEAFMVGLNDSLARELLWREFPVGLDATYFHNFWGGSEADIAAINSFDRNGALGAHTADQATGGNLVLLIRADLFRRYPNALVFAVEAVWNPDRKTRSFGKDPRKWPLFRGSIAADINFFGFDVTDPRGPESGAPGTFAGWYFVIEEHVGEPRFGLEPEPTKTPDGSWNDVSWSAVKLDRGCLSTDPASAPPTPSRETVAWGTNSAAMASILMRRPYRVAMHGRALLAAAGT